jgi:uncharacterized surface protein with fasciclin (FAS1) repeats/DNA-directed RNA polymerase subunit RPC12/RpoP
MPTLCLKCGTPAVDDKSLYCNKCGTQLIHPTAEKSEDCPQCGTKIPDKKSVFCSRCGSPISQNPSEDIEISHSIGIETTMQENKKPSKKGTLLSGVGSLSGSHKSLSHKSQPKKPMKRTSIIIISLVFFIVFVIIILILSQPGSLNPASSNDPVMESSTNVVIPAHITPIPTLSGITIIPTTQIALMAVGTSTQTQIPPSTPTPTKTSTTPVAPKTQAGIKNIVETAGSDGRFTTLITAIKAAGLNDTLSDPDSNFTLFAPTDDAFRNLPAGTMDSLLVDPQGNLLQILLSHVVSGKVISADLGKLTSIETLQGGSLPISVSVSTINVDGARVIAPDIMCSNGVIHVVDTVMLPPD